MAELLTVAEVASELRVGTTSVLRLIARGELRAIRSIGRGAGYRVRREWLDDFLRAREVEPRPIDPSAPSSPRLARGRPPKTDVFRSVADARRGLRLTREGGRR